MNQVLYKGQPFHYQTFEAEGKRYFKLYQNGVLMKTVEQNELDIKSIVSLILDAYYQHPSAPSSRIMVR